MIYIFDTGCFIVTSFYFKDRFPSFWDKFNDYIQNGRIISVREVFNELDKNSTKEELREWVQQNKRIFLVPTQEETAFVGEIFKINHFQQLIPERKRLVGNPLADPFVIAAAKIKNACVVTEELHKTNAARIPNICQHFDVDCTDFQGFM